jgi:hypothetical protein
VPRIFNGTSDGVSINIDLSAYTAVTIDVGTRLVAPPLNRGIFEYANPNWTIGGCTCVPNNGAPNGLISFADSTGTNFWTDHFVTPAGPNVGYTAGFDRAARQNYLWLSGVAQTLTPVTHNVVAYGTFASSALNIYVRNALGAPSLFLAGDVYSVSVWNRILTTSEALMLGGGVSAISAAPSGLICHIPMRGASPEPSYVIPHAKGTLVGTTYSKTPTYSPLWLGNRRNRGLE